MAVPSEVSVTLGARVNAVKALMNVAQTPPDQRAAYVEAGLDLAPDGGGRRVDEPLEGGEGGR